MSAHLRVAETQTRGTMRIVEVRGELVFGPTLDNLKEAITKDKIPTSSTLLFDVRACTHLDSSALGLFVSLETESEEEVRILCLEGGSVHRMLQKTHLDRVLQIFFDPEAAYR